ncbi:uncharacterized protein LOC113657731 isoform X21 [Tachysurus fulvidraco]|uniref:uncharacterized protein LOC113657731 isoform X21 n=1 Tax=Tachysurus fulvidraco TaxID=1234273 RepID=UPI001FEE31EF|nr:uncharacterized protein LOC113657731 isoform X21 [Tachysurus fulvidraco]
MCDQRTPKRHSPAPVPYGLQELVEAMSWSVIMDKPENICQFLLDYTLELLQFKNENPSLDQRESIIKFHQLKEKAYIRRLSEQSECSKSDEDSSTSPAEWEEKEMPTSGLGRITGQEPSEDSDLEVKVVHKAQMDTKDALLGDEDASDIGDSTHVREVSLTTPELVHDVEILQEALLEEEDALLVDEGASAIADIIHISEVSLTTPELVLDVEVLQEALLEDENALVSDKKALDDEAKTDFRDVSVTPPEQAELPRETPLDKVAVLGDEEALDIEDRTYISEVSPTTLELVPDVEVLQEVSLEEIALVSDEVSEDEARTFFRDVSVTPPEQAELLRKTPLDKVAVLGDEEALDIEDRTYISEVSPTTLELVPDVEVLQKASLEEIALVSDEVSEDEARTFFRDVSVTPPEQAELLRKTPLDKEDVLLGDEEASDIADSSHISEVSLTTPEFVPDVAFLRETSLEEDNALVSDEESEDEARTYFRDVSVTPSEQAELLKETQLDKDALLGDEEASDIGDSTYISQVSLTTSELVPDVEVLEEALLEEEDALLGDEGASAIADRIHITEVSLTTPELVPDVGALQEASLEEDALLGDEEASDIGDSTHISEVSLTTSELVPDVEILQEVSLEEAEYLPRPPSQAKRSSPKALKRWVRKTKGSKSDGEICDKIKSVPLVKSLSLQDSVLMSCKMTEKTLQEVPRDKEDALLGDEEASDIGDSTHVREVSLTTPELVPDVEVLQEATLEEEDALVSKEKSSYEEDSTDFIGVSLTIPELTELPQEIPLDEVYALLSDEKSPDDEYRTDFRDVSETPPEQAELLKETPPDKEDALLGDEEASAIADRIHITEVSLSTSELVPDAEILQEALLEEEDALLVDEGASAIADRIHITEVSLTTPELVPDVGALQEASLEEDALLGDEEASDIGDSTHISEVSLTTSELVPDVEILQEASLEEAEHLPRPPSQPKRSLPKSLKRWVRKTKDQSSKSDGEICDKPKSVSLVKSLSLQDSVFMFCKVTDKTLPEASLLKEDVSVSSKESPSVESYPVTELIQTQPELVELLHEAPLDKVSDEKFSDAGDSTDSLTEPETAELLLDEEHVQRSGGDSSDSVKSSHFTELSLTPPEFAKVLQEVPQYKDYALLSDKKSNGEDSNHFSEIDLTPPDLTEVLQEASLDEEGALLSDKKTSDGADIIHISEVSVTTTELPDVKLHQDTSLDKVKRELAARSPDGSEKFQSEVLPHKVSSEDITMQTRASLSSERLSSSSSSSSSSSPAYPSTSTLGSPMDLVVHVHKKEWRLSRHTSRTSTAPHRVSSMKPCHLLPSRQPPQSAAKDSSKKIVGKPQRSTKEVRFPPISSQHRRRPDSQASRSPALPRTTEKVELPQIDPRLQRPVPSQGIRARSSMKEGIKLFHLPHRREQGVLSTEILLQSQYRNGASIQTIGPGSVVLRGFSKTPKAQKHIRGASGTSRQL